MDKILYVTITRLNFFWIAFVFYLEAKFVVTHLNALQILIREKNNYVKVLLITTYLLIDSDRFSLAIDEGYPYSSRRHPRLADMIPAVLGEIDGHAEDFVFEYFQIEVLAARRDPATNQSFRIVSYIHFISLMRNANYEIDYVIVKTCLIHFLPRTFQNVWAN